MFLLAIQDAFTRIAAILIEFAMQFSIPSAIAYGWETFKTRPWFFIGASVVIALLYLAVGAVVAAVDAPFGGTAENQTVVGNVVSLLLGALVGMGVTAFYLSAHDSPQTVQLGTLWHPSPYWNFLGASFLTSLAVGIGFVLLIVPGVIALLFFMFSTFIVIDRELGPIEAMKESVRITEGHRWPLLGFVLLLALIVAAGALALGVGILVAFPIATLAFAHAYRVLSDTAGRAAPADARFSANE